MLGLVGEGDPQEGCSSRRDTWREGVAASPDPGVSGLDRFCLEGRRSTEKSVGHAAYGPYLGGRAVTELVQHLGGDVVGGATQGATAVIWARKLVNWPVKKLWPERQKGK